MIDNISFSTTKFDREYLLSLFNEEIVNCNVYSNGCTKSFVNQETGEIISKTPYIEWQHKGLNVRVYDSTKANPKGRLVFDGSPHMYKNNGDHNYDDLGWSEALKQMMEIIDLLRLTPFACRLYKIEIGVCIYETNFHDLKSSIVMNGVKTPDITHNGKELIFEYFDHYIKVYDKTDQSSNYVGCPKDLVRAEVGYRGKRIIQRLFGINGDPTLEHLFHVHPSKILADFIKHHVGMVYYDSAIYDDTPHKYKYSNPSYFLQLSDVKRSRIRKKSR